MITSEWSRRVIRAGIKYTHPIKMTTTHTDSFLLRIAYETLVQAYRDRDHPEQQIADDAQDFLDSETASTMRDALMGNGVLWSPLASGGRGKKSKRWGVRSRSSLMGETAR